MFLSSFLLLQGSGALRQPVSCTSFFVTVQSLTVTSKKPFQIGFADGIFAFKPVFCYGQRSKCADLLNNYLSSIFIAFIFPSDSLSRLMGAEMAIYHIKYSIICLHAQAVLNMTARRFCRFFREPWSHFQYLWSRVFLRKYLPCNFSFLQVLLKQLTFQPFWFRL